VNERRYLPWLIAVILPVLVLLWTREETPPPPPESPPAPSSNQIPEGLELLAPARGQAPRPPDYYPDWSGGEQARRFEPPEPAPDAYRFRPLSQREQRRMGQQSTGGYAEPYSPPRYDTPTDDWSRPYAPPAPRDIGREPMMPEPWQQGWGAEGYSYRPDAPPPDPRGRWQGPYTRPPAQPPYPTEPIRPFDEDMQWGATPSRPTPPSHRMYPALEQSGGRSFTSL
jgi:hypothetical protein